jgi:hypothetical protein
MSRRATILACTVAAAVAACSSDGVLLRDAGANGDMILQCYDGPGLPPYGLAVANGSVYWTGIGPTSFVVFRSPLAEQTPTIVADVSMGPTDTVWLRGIAVDDAAVYLAAGCAGEVWRAPLDGGAPTLLATDHGCVHGVAVDRENVYFTVAGELAGAVWKVPIAGGSATSLAGAETMFAECGEAIAVTATDVYWTDPCAAGTLSKVPIAGGAVTVLGVGSEAVTVDDTNVYWEALGSIRSQPLAGGMSRVIAPTTASQGAPVYGIAVDGSDVYWSQGPSRGAGTILRAPIAGGTPTAVASVPFVGAIALAPGVVYTSQGSNCITIASR